ncbi:MAG: hypothetical protein U0412_03905 [Nitrospira sp.]
MPVLPPEAGGEDEAAGAVVEAGVEAASVLAGVELVGVAFDESPLGGLSLSE